MSTRQVTSVALILLALLRNDTICIVSTRSEIVFGNLQKLDRGLITDHVCCRHLTVEGL